MKKWMTGILIAVVLTGCAGEKPPAYETEGTMPVSAMEKPEAGEIGVWMPEEAIRAAMAGEDGSQVYTWGEYELRLQTVDGGDIRRTLEDLTGMDYGRLTVMNRKKGDLELYQTVWCSAAEEQTLISRAVVADDGHHHYCVSLTAPEDVDAEELYARIFQSVVVLDPSAKK